MIAIKNIAGCARRTGSAAVFAISVLLLAGCGALPDRPARVTLYDFGPGPLAAPATSGAAALAPITLADIDSDARLDSAQLLYRLGYADANELRPYTASRWSAPPAQLVRQRLRDTLAERRTVLGGLEAANLARTEGRTPDLLRITLEEFSQYFESPGASVGLVKLRATLIRSSPGGERVLGQRQITVQRPAPGADAAGGVKALVAATDAAVADVSAWIEQVR